MSTPGLVRSPLLDQLLATRDKLRTGCQQLEDVARTRSLTAREHTALQFGYDVLAGRNPRS